MLDQHKHGPGSPVASVYRSDVHRILPPFPPSGLRRLPGEDLGNGRRPPAGHAARTRRRDIRHDRQLREHHDRSRLLRQDHPGVVPADLRPAGRAGGARRLHHLAAGGGPFTHTRLAPARSVMNVVKRPRQKTHIAKQILIDVCCYISWMLFKLLPVNRLHYLNCSVTSTCSLLRSSRPSAAARSATCPPPERTAPSASGSGTHARSSSGEGHRRGPRSGVHAFILLEGHRFCVFTGCLLGFVIEWC